ncbi:MAG: putative bifunctional diguanylate cyclase/phosphodiesterase [Ilumatobacteraceae bacterium]
MTELAGSETLESHLLALAGRGGSGQVGGLYAELPVVLENLEIGCVAVCVQHRVAWSDADLEALQDSVVAVSTELSMRMSAREVQRTKMLVTSHGQVHQLIARAAPLREVLTEVCRTIERFDPTLIPCVLQLDSSSNTLHSGVGPSLPPAYLAAVDGVVIGPSIGTCGPAAWFEQLTISPDLGADPKWSPIIELARSAGVAHCWSMPIKAAGGEVLGTLAFYGREPREPLPEHVGLLHDWAPVAGIAIERSRANARLTHDALHDGLTGLPNRRAIFEQLDGALRRAGHDATAAVLFIDLDGLKAMNDTLGHDRADEMIREVARRLSDTIRGDDFVGRFGGDEFVVIVERIADASQAARLGARLLEAVARPLPGLEARFVTASIGIALIRSNTVEPREAIREADEAMYVAKRSGRDRCVFSEAGHPVQAGRRLQLARELQGAVARGEMRIVFQPVVALTGMQIVGVEALLRWRSPTFGEVSPGEFIPIAEDTGTIVPLGAWVLRESCETMAQLGELGRHLELDVNVSAVQVCHPDFPLWVRQTLVHAEFPANRLGLEITETALMSPHALTEQNLRDVHALGVRIGLDDFGTGYSSLSGLKRHPFNAIKIDRSFVGGMLENASDHAIVDAVISLARALDCTVTAEGVETEQQLSTLQALGCHRAQGFLLARPMPTDKLTALLARQSKRTLVGVL